MNLLLATKRFYKTHFIHFQWMFGKTVVLKVLENSQKNVLSNVPFKQMDLPNPPIYNHNETGSTANVSCECSENF